MSGFNSELILIFLAIPPLSSCLWSVKRKASGFKWKVIMIVVNSPELTLVGLPEETIFFFLLIMF